LFEDGFEVFDNLLEENVGIGKITGFFEAFVSGARRCRGSLCRVRLFAVH
jgi:hypothetical protein